MSSPPAPTYEQYRTIVEEYRFQVQLNWDRTKYLIGYNTAVFAAGVGLLKLGGSFGRALVVGVFVIGMFGCLLTAVATRTQHAYYATTRNQMIQLAGQLDLGDAAIAATPGASGASRSRLQKLTRVQSLIYAVLLATGLADVLSAVYVILRR